MSDADQRKRERARQAWPSRDDASARLMERARVEGWKQVRDEVFTTATDHFASGPYTGDRTRQRKARIMKAAETWDTLTRLWPAKERAAARVLIGGYFGHGDCWLGKLWLNAVRATKGLKPTPDRKPVAKLRRETDKTLALFDGGPNAR